MEKTDLLITIGKRIKAARRLKNMTQNELAMECGFEKASLSRIEAGKTNITIGTLHRIITALDMPMVELFND